MLSDEELKEAREYASALVRSNETAYVLPGSLKDARTTIKLVDEVSSLKARLAEVERDLDTRPMLSIDTIEQLTAECIAEWLDGAGPTPRVNAQTFARMIRNGEWRTK